METSIVGRPNRDDGPATAVTVTLPAPSTTIKSTPPSQESDDGLIEEFTKALRESNDDHQILNLVKYTLRRHLIKIIETPNTFYILLLDPDLYFSLLSTSDTLLCQLEYKEEPGDLHHHLHKKHKFFPLGRLKAFHRKDKTAMSESYRDLSYLVGLDFSTEPRSLWLIYDYSIEDNDDFDGGDTGEHKLYLNQIATDSDSCRLLAHIFDLGQICEDVNKWEPNEGLPENEVLNSLKASMFLLGETLDLKALKLRSDVASKPDLHSGQEESLHQDPSLPEDKVKDSSAKPDVPLRKTLDHKASKSHSGVLSKPHPYAEQEESPGPELPLEQSSIPETDERRSTSGAHGGEPCSQTARRLTRVPRSSSSPAKL